MNISTFLENKIEWIFLRKRYLADIRQFLDANLIQVVVWQRRVGKSYYIYQVIKYLLDKKLIKLDNIFYINKERHTFDNIVDYKTLFQVFNEWYQNKGNEKILLVCIDEIQEIKDWEKFVLSIWSMYDNIKIIISGSNSKLLSKDISTKLRGRYFVKYIYPLSFKEFVKFYSIRKNEQNFYKYLYFWWLPELKNIISKESKINYLKSLYDTIFVKDIVEYFNIRNPKILKQIHKFLFSEIWNLISIKNIHWYLKNLWYGLSLETLYSYLDYTVSSFLFYEVDRFDLKWKKILEWVNKFYTNDLGVRNSIIWYQDKDIWRLLENIIFLHLKINNFETYIGKFYDKEIDFVAEKNWDRIYIQVAYLLSDKNVVEREIWNLLKIKDWWPKVVLSMDKIYKWKIEGIEIKNIIDWLYEMW